MSRRNPALREAPQQRSHPPRKPVEPAARRSSVDRIAEERKPAELEHSSVAVAQRSSVAPAAEHSSADLAAARKVAAMGYRCPAGAERKPAAPVRPEFGNYRSATVADSRRHSDRAVGLNRWSPLTSRQAIVADRRTRVRRMLAAPTDLVQPDRGTSAGNRRKTAAANRPTSPAPVPALAAARLLPRTVRAAARNPADRVVVAHKPVDPGGAHKPADREVEDMPVVPAAARKLAGQPRRQSNSAAAAHLPSGSDWDCWPARKTATKKKNTPPERGQSQRMSRREPAAQIRPDRRRAGQTPHSCPTTAASPSRNYSNCIVSISRPNASQNECRGKGNPLGFKKNSFLPQTGRSHGRQSGMVTAIPFQSIEREQRNERR
jgi:hypothetical protein